MASAGDKKTPSQGYLEDVPMSSSQATFLRNILKQSYLDPSYVSSSLSVVSIQTIHNAELGRQFLQKRTEMQALNRSRQELKELYGFTVARKSNVFLRKVVANGLKVQETSYNAFGDSSKGIYVSKHCDVMLKFAENHHDRCQFLRILVHRLVPGKLLSTNHGTDKLPPSEHFDGHIALVRPAIDNNLLVQVMLSQIYIYEFDRENKPSTHPRQCLPYAVITFERTPGSTIPQGMPNEQTNQPEQQQQKQHLTTETQLRQIKCKTDQNEKQQVDLRLLSEKPQTKMPVTASGLGAIPVTLVQKSAPSRSAPTISTASIPRGGTPPQRVITFRDIAPMQSAIVGSIPTPISPQASHLGSSLTSSSVRPSMVGTILTPNSPQASHIRSNQACSTIMPSIVGSIPTPNSPQTLHLGSNLTCSTPMTTIVGSIPTTNVPQTSYFGSNCITIGSPMVGSISTPNSPQASHFVSNLTSPTIAKAQYIRIISAAEAQKLLQNTPGKTKLMFASPLQSTKIPQVRAAASSVSGRGCDVSKVAIPRIVASSVSGRGCAPIQSTKIPQVRAAASSVSGRGCDVSKVAIPRRVASSVSGRGCAPIQSTQIPQVRAAASSVSGRGCDVSKVAIPGRVATQATVRPTLLYPVQQKSIQPLNHPVFLRSIAPKGHHMLVTSPVRNLREVSHEHQPQDMSDFVNGTVPPMTSENSQTLGDPDFSTVKPIEIAPIEGYDEPAICVKQEWRGGTTAANSAINLIEDDDCPSVTNITPVVTPDPSALSSYASDHQEVVQPSLQQQIAEFALVEEQVARAHQVDEEVPVGGKEIIHHRPQKREENPAQVNTEVIPEPQIAVKIRECEAAVAPQHVSQSMASSPGLPDLPPVVSEVKPVAIEGPDLKETDKQTTPTEENADNKPKKVLHHYVRTTEDGSIEVVGEMVLESELAKRQAEMNLSANQSWDLDSLDDEDDGDMTEMISETTLKIVSTSSGAHAKDLEDGNEQGGTSFQRSSDISSASVHKTDMSAEAAKEPSSLPPVKRSEPNMCTSQSELLDSPTDHSGTCTGLQSDKKSSQSELTTVQSTDAEAAHPAISPLSSVSNSCAIVKEEEDGETELKTVFKNDGVEINGTLILSEALLIDVHPNFQPPAPHILDQPHNVSKDRGVNSHDGMGTVSNECSSPSTSKVSGKLATKKSAGSIVKNKQKSSNTLVSKKVKERPPPKHKAKSADKMVYGTVRTVSTDEIRQRSYLGDLDSSHSLRLSLTDFQPTDPTAEDFTEFDTDIDFTPVSIYPNGVYERIAWEAAEKDPAYQPVVKLMDVKNTQRHYASVQPPSPVHLSDDEYALPKSKPSKLKIKAIPTWSPKMRKLLTARKSASKGSMLPLRHGVKLSHPSCVPSTTNWLSFTTTTLPGSMDSLCAYNTPSATSGKKDKNKTVSTALPDSEHEASIKNQGEKSISMTLELTKKTNIVEPTVDVESAKITEAAQEAKTSPVIVSEIKIPNVGKKKCKAPVKRGKQSFRTKSSSSKDDGTSSSGTEYTMPRQKKNKQSRILPVRRGRSLAAVIQENPIGIPNEELGYHLEMSLSLAEGKKISEGKRKKGEKKVCRVKENQEPETTKSFFNPQIPLIRKDPTYVERTIYKPEIPGILDAPADGPLKKNEAPEEVPVKEVKKPAGLEGPMELVTNDTAFLALLQSRLLLAKTEAEAESLKATIAVLCPINKSKSDTGLQNSNKKTAIVASKSTLPIESDDFDYDEDIAADEKKIPCPTGGPTLADSEDQVTLASSFQNTPCDDRLVDLQDERWKILHALEGLEEENEDAAPSTDSKQREGNSTKAPSTSGKNKGLAKSKKSKKHRNEPPDTLHSTTPVETCKTEGPVEAIFSGEEELHKTRLSRSRRKRILSSDSESDGEVEKKGRSGKQDTDHVATNKVVVEQNSKRPREHSEENDKRKRSKSMLYTDSEVIQNMLIPTTVPKKEKTNLFNGYGEEEVRNSGNVDQWIQEIDKISQSLEDSKVGNVLERVIASTKPSVITDAGHSTKKTCDESKDSSSKDVDISINVKRKEIEARLEVEEREIEISPEIKEKECDTSSKVNEKEIETSTEVEESEKSSLHVTSHPGKINAEEIKAHSKKEVDGQDIKAQTACVSNSVNPDQLENKTLNKKPKKQKLDINTYFARVAKRRNSASIDESGQFNPSTAGNLEKVVQATVKEIPLAIPDLNTNDIRKILENVYKNDQVLHRHTSKSGSATVVREPSSVTEGEHSSSASIPIEHVMTPEEILFRVGYLQDNIENVCMKRKELIADMAVIKRKLASNPKPDILRKLEQETQNLDPFIIGLYIDEDIIKRELDKVRGKVKGLPNQPLPASLLLTDEVEPLQTQTRIPLILMTKLLNDKYEALSALKLDYMALNAQWRSTNVLDTSRFRTLQDNYAFVKDQRYKILTMLCKSKDLRISARKYYDELCYYRKWRDPFYNDYKKNSNPCTKDRIQFIDTKIAELDAHVNLLCKVLGLPRENLRSPNRYELQSPNVPVQCGQTVFRSVGPNPTPGRAKAEQEEKPPAWTISEAKITGEKPPWSRTVHATSQKPPCPVTSGNITNCPALPFSIETPPWLQKRCQKLEDGSIWLGSQNAAHGQSLVPCVNLSMGDKDYRPLEVKPNSQTPQTDLTSSGHNVVYHDVMRANLNPTKTKHVSPVICQTPSDTFEKTDGKVVKLRDNLCGSLLDSSSQEKPSISEISQKTGLDMPNVELQSSLQLTPQMDICGDDAVDFSDLVIDIPETPADTEEKSTLDGTTEKNVIDTVVDTEKSQDMQKSTLLMTDSVKKLDSISHAVSSTEFSKCIGSTSIKENKMTNEKTECGMVEPSILPSVGSDSLLTRQASAGRNNTQISRILKGVELEVSRESSVKDHEKLCPKSLSGSRRPSIDNTDSKQHQSTETPMGSQIKGTNSVTIPQKSTLPISRKSSNGKIKPTDRAQQESPKAERRVCGTKRPKAKDQQSSHAILEGSKRSDKHKGCKNPMAKQQQCTTGVIVESRERSDVHKATKQQSTNIGIKQSSSCRKKSVSEEQHLIKTSPNEPVKVSAIISPKEKMKSVEVDRRRTVLGSPKAKSVITKDWSFGDALSSAGCTKNIKDGKCSEGKKGTKKPVQTQPTCSTSDLKNSKVKCFELLNSNVSKTKENPTHSSKKGSTALNEGSDNNGVVAKEPVKERTRISKSQSLQQKPEVEFDDEIKCEKSAVERRQELLQQVLKKKSDLTKILADNKSLDTSRITTDTTPAQTPSEQHTGAVKANAKRVPHDIHKKRQSVDLPADTERSVNVMPDSTSGTLAGSNSTCPVRSDSIAVKMVLKENKTEKPRCLHPVIDKTMKKQNTVETVEMKEKERTKSTLTATPVPNVEKGKVPSETMLTATQELGNEMPDSTSGNEAAATLPDSNEPRITADSEKLKVTEPSPTVQDKISSAEVDALIASVRQSLANDVFEARNKISEEFHNSEMPPNVTDSSYLLDGEACGASNDETQYARMRAAFLAEQSMSNKLPEAYKRFGNSDPRKERCPATCQDHSDSGIENTQKSENLWQQFIREKVHDSSDGNPWQSFLKRYKPQQTWGESLGKHAKGKRESSPWREEPQREASVSHSVQHGQRSDSHRSRSRSPYNRKRDEQSVHDKDCGRSLRRKSQDHRSQERPGSHREEKDYRKRDERSVDKDQDHRRRETKGRDSQDFRCRNNQEFRRRDGRSPHDRDYRKRDAHGSRSVSYRESRH